MNDSFDVIKKRKRQPKLVADIVPITHKGIAPVSSNSSMRKGKAERQAYVNPRSIKTAGVTIESSASGGHKGTDQLINNYEKYNPIQNIWKPALVVQSTILAPEYSSFQSEVHLPDQNLYASNTPSLIAPFNTTQYPSFQKNTNNQQIEDIQKPYPVKYPPQDFHAVKPNTQEALRGKPTDTIFALNENKFGVSMQGEQIANAAEMHADLSQYPHYTKPRDSRQVSGQNEVKVEKQTIDPMLIHNVEEKQEETKASQEHETAPQMNVSILPAPDISKNVEKQKIAKPKANAKPKSNKQKYEINDTLLKQYTNLSSKPNEPPSIPSGIQPADMSLFDAPAPQYDDFLNVD